MPITYRWLTPKPGGGMVPELVEGTVRCSTLLDFGLLHYAYIKKYIAIKNQVEITAQ